MEDCWLENEEFNFDIPLSPLDGNKPIEAVPITTNDSADNDDYDDEVFFGPVSHMERCAAVVAKKDVVEPIKPLEPAEQALLLQESAKLSCLLKLQPLAESNQQNNIQPLRRDSSGIDIERLRMFRDKLMSSENKENISNSSEDDIPALNKKKTIKTSFLEEESKIGNNCDSIRVPKSSSPSMRKTSSLPNRRSPVGGGDKKTQASRLAIPSASSIPKVQSRIARPSNIPSLKPGLLQGQTRLRGGATQESRLKPMKAKKLENVSVAAEPVKPKIGLHGKGSSLQKSSSSSSFVTPKNGREGKHVRSNTAENQTSRKSLNCSTSMSQLRFSKPNHNSTPKQQPSRLNTSARRSVGSVVGSASAAASIKKSSFSKGTPSKPAMEKSSLNAKSKAQGTPNNGRGPLRRSLVPKLGAGANETPLKSKQGQRRGSLLKYPSMRASPDRKTSCGNNGLNRSGTFVLEDVKPDANGNISLIDVTSEDRTSNIATDILVMCSSTKDNGQSEKTLGKTGSSTSNALNEDHELFGTEILVPKVPIVHTSPLLKFDSPLPEHLISDPFATGSTPPTLAMKDAVLAPEQMETNLIQF